jgi:hypothetical protein
MYISDILFIKYMNTLKPVAATAGGFFLIFSYFSLLFLILQQEKACTKICTQSKIASLQ